MLQFNQVATSAINTYYMISEWKLSVILNILKKIDHQMQDFDHAKDMELQLISTVFKLSWIKWSALRIWGKCDRNHDSGKTQYPQISLNHY